jgi:hypothetical protein
MRYGKFGIEEPGITAVWNLLQGGEEGNERERDEEKDIVHNSDC